MKLKALCFDDYPGLRPGEIDGSKSLIASNYGVLTFRLWQTRLAKQRERASFQFRLCFDAPDTSIEQPPQSTGARFAARRHESQNSSDCGKRDDFATNRVLQRPLKRFLINRACQIHQGARWRGQWHSVLGTPHFPRYGKCLVGAKPSRLPSQPIRSDQFDSLRLYAIQFPQPRRRAMRDQRFGSAP